MRIDCDHQQAPAASRALLESCTWSRSSFFGDEGPRAPDALLDGPIGRTFHFTADDGGPRCQVWLPISNRAAASGLPDIAAHEGFHVAAGANVYHWTHEAFASLAAQLSHLRQESDTEPRVPRRQLGELLLNQARLFSGFYTAQQMRVETVPNPEPAVMQRFYSRARVTGVDLYEVAGLRRLASLARAVRDVRCSSRPHLYHADCPMDAAVEAWILDLLPDMRHRVREVLDLG